MRICNKCGGENTTTTQKVCTSCKRAYDEGYYADPKNREAQKARVRVRNERITADNREKLLEYLRGHPCVDCGEVDPVVLQFDHLGDKDQAVSHLVRGAYSWQRVLKEISKCEVRCANCHCRKTAVQFGWFKHLQALPS